MLVNMKEEMEMYHFKVCIVLGLKFPMCTLKFEFQLLCETLVPLVVEGIKGREAVVVLVQANGLD